MLSCLILRKWVISKEWFITEMSVYRIPSFFPIPFMIRLEMCSEINVKNAFKHGSSTLCIRCYFLQLPYPSYKSSCPSFVFSALWLWPTLCWLVMALSTKSWKIELPKKSSLRIVPLLSFLSFFCLVFSHFSPIEFWVPSCCWGWGLVTVTLLCSL